MSKDSFSVVIACSRDADALVATLQSLCEIDYPPGFDVIVVDDGRSKGRGSAIGLAMDKGMSIRYCEAPDIRKAAAWNFAGQEASGEYVAFLDDGCMPPPGWLSAYRAAFDVWNVGVAGGPDLPPKNASFLERSLCYVLDSFVGGIGMRAGADYTGRYYPRSRNMAARKEAIRLAGGFSDKYPETPEVPLIHRMARIGYKADYAPDAWVRRHRDAGIFGFLGRSFRLGRQRGSGGLQPDLRRVYGAALALLVLPGLLALYPVTHGLGMRLIESVIGVYTLALALTALYGIAVARTPLAVITVPVLTVMHHGAHITGYVAGLLSGLRHRQGFRKTRIVTR